MENHKIVISLADAQATQRLGRQLGAVLPAGSVILLEGDLGAGKTTLVQGIGQGLNIAIPIVSPTFTLVNEYHEGRLPLYHLDLYRLESEELAELCPEIYWEGQEVPAGITAIEWATRLPYRPPDYLDIALIFTPQGREAILQPIGHSLLNIMQISRPNGQKLTSEEIKHLEKLKALIEKAALDGVVTPDERRNILNAIFQDNQVTPDEMKLYRELIEEKVIAGEIEWSWD